LRLTLEEDITADPTFFIVTLAMKPSLPAFTIVGCPTTAITPCCGAPPSSTKYAIIAAPIASSTRVTSIASTGPLSLGGPDYPEHYLHSPSFSYY
jgi:hypothetical protein